MKSGFWFNTVMLCLFAFTIVNADDWSQWRGNNRDGISNEKNLLKQWPEDGPKLLWSFEGLGDGYSSISVAGDLVYLTGESDDKEAVFCLNREGKLLWKTIYGTKWKDSFPAMRSTPTLDGEFLYVISGTGEVVAVNRKNGQIKWSVDMMKKFDADFHSWGIAESPLIVDNKIICTPGGDEASVIALDKTNGNLIWQTTELSEPANYCSPILIERGGKKIIATMLAESFVGIDASNGKLLWRDKFSDYQGDAKDINPVTPIYHNGEIYTTSGYNDGGAMYSLSTDGLSIKRKWVDTTLDVHIGGAVLVDGFIYGANWENNSNGSWVCLDWKTGKVMYEKKWINKGSIIAAEGMLYCYTEKKGIVGLVKANPQEFAMVSEFKLPLGSGQHWAHPAISDGRLFVRHGEALMVYDIKAK